MCLPGVTHEKGSEEREHNQLGPDSKYTNKCGRGSMRLRREQHKAMVQLEREWNQPDAAGDNKLNVEKEQSSREKKSKSWGIRGSNLAGKRKAGSSKEQTEEESVRVGTEVVDTADKSSASNVENTGAVYAALRKLWRRGHRGTEGTTITNERFKAHFEKLTGERFENPREEIAIAVPVNEVMDIRQELLAMEENDLLIEEPDEEEIECEGIQLEKGPSKNDIHEGIRRWDEERSGKNGSIYA